MDIVGYAKRVVEEELSSIFREVESNVSTYSNRLSDIAWIIRDFTMRGGKRLRAALVLLGYWSSKWGGEISDTVSKVMASIELLQSYLLVHDDIMDRDEIRRGGPTVFAWFRDRCHSSGMLGDCYHYGVSQAITAGDLLEALAVRYLSQASRKIAYDLLQKYTEGLFKVALGQYLDVYYSRLPLREVREEDIILVYKLKTASYTVELPLHLGAIASESASKRLLDELSSYAIPAGIAFQIRDDIIGLFGKPEITGKPAGSDVLQRKKTILITKAFEQSNSSDRAFLEEIYDSSRDITGDDVERVKKIVVESGALDYSLKLIDNYVGEAENALSNMREVSPGARNLLGELLKKLAYREY
ncbi:polyprenyl synthetase family protein [Thermogladius sp. 4427co]|uniref:polyprenyl synthetase family protein n=1 Tax=Thermogladius sp. 4427co TaxID=3450718 RepID=UPI003F79132B